MSLIISVSGLRGVIGETLTPRVATDYAWAFSQMTPEDGPFVITRDGRASGVVLADAIHSTLNMSGRSTIDAGIAATPTLGVLIRQLGAAGGIQITASHNPAEYNGMKLFTNEGRVIPKLPGELVKRKYEEHNEVLIKRHDEMGTRSSCEDIVSEHIGLISETINVDEIRARNFHVLLDSNRGSGSRLGRVFLEKLGCRVTMLGESPDGKFEHTPEPTEENLQPVLQNVKDCGADIGFCQDPDADRLAVIDSEGRYLGEEYTVAICVDHVLRSRGPGVIVTNCSSSRMSEDITLKHGGIFYRCPVGEANVVDMMKAQNAIFGGEGNGGPIDPKVGFVRDSFVGMAQILDAMVRREMSVAELAAELPRYVIVKKKFNLPFSRANTLRSLLQDKYKDQRTDLMDGFRVDIADSWLLVRMSNTEPVVRIIAEAKTEERANQFCIDAEELLHEATGS